jgi:hypothetical protein
VSSGPVPRWIGKPGHDTEQNLYRRPSGGEFHAEDGSALGMLPCSPERRPRRCIPVHWSEYLLTKRLANPRREKGVSMDCASCGKRLPEGARLCADCGVAADGAASQAAAPEPSRYGRRADEPPPEPAYGDAGSRGIAPGANSAFGRLAARMKAILFSPKREWTVIAREDAAPAPMYLRYVLPLAAIGAIASLSGSAFVGIPALPQGMVRLSLAAAVAGAVLHLAMTFVTVFVVARIVAALAPTFGGQKNARRALQVTAYSFTPAWMASVLTILPALAPLAGLLGIYGLYLLYLGLPALMRSTPDKTLGYTVVIVLYTVVVSVAIGVGSSLVLNALLPDTPAPPPGAGVA